MVVGETHGAISRWWFQRFCIFTPKIGEGRTHVDDHIFQMGWFNHQPAWFLLVDLLGGDEKLPVHVEMFNKPLY